MAELPPLPTTFSLERQEVDEQPVQLQHAVCQLPKDFGNRDLLTWDRLPKEVLQGGQNLVHILTELRAPDSGWPINVPFNVDTVSPYISEEVYEFLESLRQFAIQTRGALSVFQDDTLQLIDWQIRQVELANLIPQLRWEAASSSYEIMRLLTGMRAKCYRDETQSGLVRLGLVLQDTVAETELDLVAGTLLNRPDGLPNDAEIQIEDGDFCQVPIAVSKLTSQIGEHLQQNNPILKAFFKGVIVNLLLPGRRWVKTTLTLSLQISFVVETPQSERGWRLGGGQASVAETGLTLEDFVMPEIPALEELDDLMIDLPNRELDDASEDLFADWGFPDDSPRPSESNGHRPPEIEEHSAESLESPVADLLQTWITVTDDRWTQNFAEMIARQALINRLPLSKLLAKLAVPRVGLDRLINPLVQRTCNAVQLIHGDVALFKQNFFQHPIFLKDLIPRLLWYVNRSAATVMQLIEGVNARILLPGEPWQLGQLRLLATLQITTDLFDSRIDLGSGQVLSEMPPTLPRSGMVITPFHALCQRPQSVAHIEHRLYQILRQKAPEIDWLLKGTTINLHLLNNDVADDAPPGTDNLTGVIELGLTLAFIPAPTESFLRPAMRVGTMAS